MLENKEIIKLINEINTLIKSIMYISFLIIICLIICFLESI